MERRTNNTRLRVPLWTTAPGYSPPPSPVNLEHRWDKGKEEDFQTQMDELGIIGLRDSLEEEMNEVVALLKEKDLLSDVGTPESEEGPPPAFEDLSCHLRELLDSEPLPQPTGADCFSPSQNEYGVSLELWRYDGDGQKPDQTGQENVKNQILPSIEEEHTPQLFHIREKNNSKYIWMENHDDTSHEKMNHETERTLETRLQNGSHEWSYMFSFPFSRSTPHPPVLPSLPQRTLQEHPINSRTETFTELESPKADHSQLGHPCVTSSPVLFREEESGSEITPLTSADNSESKLGKCLQESKKTSFRSQHVHQVPSDSSLRKINAAPQEDCQSSSFAPAKDQSSFLYTLLSRSQHEDPHCHRPSETSHTDLNDVRKGRLNHTLPDFSKVEPKVRFPKSSYKPPRSRLPHYRRDSKPEAPIVFKSPADIVKEVLLSSTEGLLDTAASAETQNPLNTTLPEEFRCPLQASTLVQQLQDDYNKLLTKYAEAENTIDRLRLEAKVGMYSEPPTPSQPIQSGVLKEVSKMMTLNFPQAQKAELGVEGDHLTKQRLSSATSETSLHPCSIDSSRSCESLSATQRTETLAHQAHRFQLQCLTDPGLTTMSPETAERAEAYLGRHTSPETVNDFEKLLKTEKLKPSEQTQALAELAQGQESLERAYLTTREQHRQLLKQAEAKCGSFDSDRELEGLIFQLAIRLEELREWLKQTAVNQTTLDPFFNQPSPAFQPCASLKALNSQSEGLVSALDPVVTVGLEWSSVTEASDNDREQEMLPFLFHPLQQKPQHVEKDFRNFMDLDHVEMGHSYKDYSSHQTLNDGIKGEQPRRTTQNLQDSNRTFRVLPEAESLSGSSCSSHVCTSMETLPKVPLPALGLLRQQDSGKRAGGSRKSHSNLGGKTAPTENSRILRVSSQDGEISPESDSGFVGSDSSQLNPADHSSVQQSAAERPASLSLLRVTRPSVIQEKCQINPEPLSVRGPADNSSPSHTQLSSGHSRDCASAIGSTPESSGGEREARKRHSLSSSASSLPQHWPSSPLQPWPSNVISESDEELPSLTVSYHQAGQLRAHSLDQLSDRHKAFQSIQAEVALLRENLERSLRTSGSPSRFKAPRSDFQNCTPCHTAVPGDHFRSVERGTARKGPQERGQSVNEEQERRSAMSKRSASVPRLRSDRDTPESESIRHVSAHPAMAHTMQRVRAETGRGQKPTDGKNSHQQNASSDRAEQRSNDAGGVRVLLCPDCLAQCVKTQRSTARNTGLLSHTRPFSNRCPPCGTSDASREAVTPPENQSSTPKEKQPLKSPHKQTGGVYMATAPPPVLSSVPLLQYVPVCSPVLYYSLPVPSLSYPHSPSLIEERAHRSKARGQHRRSHSVDAQHSLNKYLDHTLAAASRMQQAHRSPILDIPSVNSEWWRQSIKRLGRGCCYSTRG